jgi:hypothetical protein
LHLPIPVAQDFPSLRIRSITSAAGKSALSHGIRREFFPDVGGDTRRDKLVPKRAAGQPSRLPEGGQRVYPYRAPGSAHERRPGCSAGCRRGAKREGDGGPVASRFGRLRELGEGSSVRITGKHVSFTAMRNCSRRHFLMPRRRCDYCVQALCTTRTRRSSSSNGLRKKANAPPRSACTTWPSLSCVTKMTGG